MSANRISASVSFVLGMTTLLSAVAGTSQAIVCDTPSRFEPASCISAHEEPNANTSNAGCDGNTITECVPAAGSICEGNPVWGRVVPGKCQLDSITSNPNECWEESVQTVLTLHEWRSECKVDGIDCVCVFEVEPDGNTQTVEVCDCKDQPIG